MEDIPSRLLSRRHHILIRAIITFVAVLSVALALFTVSFGSTRGAVVFFELSIALVGMGFAAILLICCCLVIRERSWQGHSFFMLSFLLYIDVILSGVIDYYTGMPYSGGKVFALETVFSALTVLIQLMFWLYESASLPGNRFKPFFTVWSCLLTVLYLVSLCINLFTGFLFRYDDFGKLIHYHGGFDTFFLLAAYLSYLVYILPQKCPAKKKVFLASVAVFPLFCLALIFVNARYEIHYEGSSTLAISLILAAYAIFFGDYMESRNLLLHQRAALAEQSRRQTELQTALMLSQIKPHFLFNAITAIRSICKTDPAEAYTSLGLFADYLRANMEALEDGRMIPFDKEFEHTEAYLTLERMRFGKELTVEYDIRCRDFSLPALTVQPIVENAVRHGATMNEEGGRIFISTEKTDEGVLITVQDNGPGFDPEALPADGRSHFGLSNVRNSLKIRDCGELRIDSAPGKGTTVRIRIREKEK